MDLNGKGFEPQIIISNQTSFRHPGVEPATIPVGELVSDFSNFSKNFAHSRLAGEITSKEQSATADNEKEKEDIAERLLQKLLTDNGAAEAHAENACRGTSEINSFFCGFSTTVHARAGASAFSNDAPAHAAASFGLHAHAADWDSIGEPLYVLLPLSDELILHRMLEAGVMLTVRLE